MPPTLGEVPASSMCTCTGAVPQVPAVFTANTPEDWGSVGESGQHSNPSAAPALLASHAACAGMSHAHLPTALPDTCPAQITLAWICARVSSGACTAAHFALLTLLGLRTAATAGGKGVESWEQPVACMKQS